MQHACLRRCIGRWKGLKRQNQSPISAESLALTRKKGKRAAPRAAIEGAGLPRRETVFQPEFREDLRYWVENDRRVALRALDLVEAIVRDPFRGIGKPEPLKHLAANTWSRRLTQEHRIVYLVRQGLIDFLQARYHY